MSLEIKAAEISAIAPKMTSKFLRNLEKNGMAASELSPKQHKNFTLSSFLFALHATPGILGERIDANELSQICLVSINRKGGTEEDDRNVKGLEELKRGEIPKGFSIEELAVLNSIYLNFERARKTNQDRLRKNGDLIEINTMRHEFATLLRYVQTMIGGGFLREISRVAGDYQSVKEICQRIDKDVIDYGTRIMQKYEEER